MSTSRLRLGQLLVDAKLITAAALEETLLAQRTDGRRLGTLLVERGLVNETQLTQILSHQLSVPWVSLLHIEFSRQLLNLVPHDVADRFCLVPIYVRHVRNQGETLYVAMDDPSNEDGLRACREHSGLPVRAMIAPPADIRNAIRVYYGVETPRARVAVTQHSPSKADTTPPPALTVREPSSPVITTAPEPEAAPVAKLSEDGGVPYADPTLPEGPGIAPVTMGPQAAPNPGALRAPDASADETPPAPEASAEVEPPAVSSDGPEIEAVELNIDPARAERLRAILEQAEEPPPPSSPPVENIPRPRGRAPRMVSLTLLDGTTINLPAKRRSRTRPTPSPDSQPSPASGASPTPPPTSTPTPTLTSEPPGPDAVQGLTARDLVLALRVVAHGADASEVLGSNVRWEQLFAALLSLMLKKHLIADWEFVDELKKNL